GANLLTVRRDTGGQYRLFNVAAGRTVTLQDLTLANGRDTTVDGGGAVLVHGTLTVVNCALVDNTATGEGGAISTSGVAGLTVRTSTFSGNTSSSAGGAVFSFHPTVITNSTFSGNTVPFNGGAVKLTGSASFSLVNNTLSGNTGGGVLFSNATNVTLSNNILANSTSGADLIASASTLNGTKNLIETTALFSSTNNLTGTL